MNINPNRPHLGISSTRKAAPKAEAAAAAPASAPSTPAESASFGSVPARIMNVQPEAVAEARDKFGGAEYIPGELIVKVDGGMETGLMSDFASEYGAKVVEKFDIPQSVFKSIGGDMMRLKLPAGIDVFEAVAAMKADDRVAYAEPNQIITLDEVNDDIAQQQGGQQGQAGEPNDLNEKLWGLKNTGQTGGTPGADVSAVDAWKVTTGDGSDDGPLIAVIDTGIDYNHPDLAANMWVNKGEVPGDGIDNDNNGVIDDVYGYNANADHGDPMDGHSHGTHCAGTIAGVGNNGEGVTGVMQNANLMAVKIFSDSGRTSTDAIVRGILYTSKMGADITSNSWGGGGRSEAIYDAFKSNDALHVIAAGNSNYDNDKRDNFPSNYDLDNIVAVAATNHDDRKASFSQWGAEKVDVSAPGRNIYSTIPGGGYGNKSGTSMATPHVSGGAGLILSAYPEASNAEIKSRLIYGSDKVDALNDISVSDGRVNFAASLEDDKVAPGAPNDFGANNVSARGATLSWTSVGDDKWGGGAAQGVELVVSDKPINPGESADLQTIALGGAAEVGDLATYQYDVLPAEGDRTVHFGLQSLDNVANRSEMRTTSFVIPGADVAMKDNFDGQQVSFSATGDFTAQQSEGRGTIFTTATNPTTAADSDLTSPSIDLTGKTGAFLKFESSSALNWGERASVQVSSDGGENWNTVSRLERREDWSEKGLDLSNYDGQTVQLRFHVDSREGRSTGGLSVDNVVLLTDKA